MKKLLLLSLIGITLVGCGEKEGEKKISNEMLVGEWSCDYSDLRAQWEKGQFLDYVKEKGEIVKVKYYMKDNTLMATYNDDEEHSRPFSIEEIQKESGKEEISSNLKIKTILELNYISNDEYNFNEIREVTYVNGTDEQNEDNNEKRKHELICKRTK